MPLYEYKCHACGKTFEVIQKFSDAPLTIHEECGGETERLLSAPAFHLKGSGWYATDYAKGNGKSLPKPGDSKSGESGSGESKSDGGSSEKGKTDSESRSKSDSGSSSSSGDSSSGSSESKPAAKPESKSSPSDSK